MNGHIKLKLAVWILAATTTVFAGLYIVEKNKCHYKFDDIQCFSKMLYYLGENN